ncbi:isoaspartyl peptidase/L-asparaginase, partial [Escherichia coli]
MKNINYKLATLTLCTLFASSALANNTQAPIRLVIHGGAGTITKDTITPEQEKEYKAKLTEALNAGYAVLNSGGTSIEAVQKSINVMEDSPLF